MPAPLLLVGGLKQVVGFMLDFPPISKEEDIYRKIAYFAHLSGYLTSICIDYAAFTYEEDGYIPSTAAILPMIPPYVCHGIGFLFSSFSKLKQASLSKFAAVLDMFKSLTYCMVGGTLTLVFMDYDEHKGKLYLPVSVSLFEILCPFISDQVKMFTDTKATDVQNDHSDGEDGSENANRCKLEKTGRQRHRKAASRITVASKGEIDMTKKSYHPLWESQPYKVDEAAGIKEILVSYMEERCALL